MPDVSELGRKVKAKYPGQYDDLDDADVGRRVKTRFPGSYDDFTEPPPLAQKPANDDDLIRQFGYDPAEVKRSPRYQANVQRFGSGLAYLMSDPDKVDRSVVARFGQGAADVIGGAHQLLVHGLNKLGAIGDDDTKYVDLFYRVLADSYEKNVRKGESGLDVARLVGNIAVPLPGGSLMKGGSAAAKIAKTALLGAAGAATQPVVDGGPGEYWSEKGKQVVAGALAAPIVSGATGAVANTVGKGVAKVLNARAGKMAPQAAEVVAAAEQHKIPVTYGDITRKPGVQKYEVQLEEVPGLGMSDFRKRQHDSARSAAEETAKELQEAFRSQRPAAIDDVELAANEGDEYARRLLDQIRNAGDDPDRVMQASIGLQNFRTGREAEDLYNRVQYLVTKNGLADNPVPTDGVKNVMKWALDDAQAAVIPNKRLITLLKDIDANIQGESNYARLRRFRSDLGDIIREHRANDNAIIGEKGVGYLERLRSAVEGDLQYWIDQSGVQEVQRAAANADDFYKRFRVPFKDAQLSWSAETTEPDQIFQKFVMEGKGDRAQKFYNALDEKGRSAVRFELVRRAMNEATDQGKEIFSPTKFFGYLQKFDDAYGTFFKGREKWEMDGLKKVMSHISRAGQFAENPPTGNRVVRQLTTFGAPIAAVGGAMVNPAATAGAVGFAGGAMVMSRFLLTTEPGKRFLLAASSRKEGSPAMQRLIEQITKQMPGTVGKAVGRHGE